PRPPAPAAPGYPPAYPPADPWGETRLTPVPGEPQYPAEPPLYIPPHQPPTPRHLRRRPWYVGCLGCLFKTLLVFLIPGLLLAVYLLFPGRTNLLLLGMDYSDPSNSIARTDTVILSSFIPARPYVGLLSVPRDLWVPIPGYGENRINTAHFFAEAESQNSGPYRAVATVEQNFGVDIDYFVRIRFEGFKDVVNALGGVDIELSEAMAGYAPGVHHLTGNKALAFARSRYGSDDFFRMQQGQIVLKAILKKLTRPAGWFRVPAVYAALRRNLHTDVPSWMWPRLGFAALRLGANGLDSRTVTREMVTPYTTAEGANILLPNWPLILPVVEEIFH
ncbi:MAG TPA: LCP family protein, partial [Anaerolineales bacterium]|nr:LCP family protein [Anaerolineales bacterium]